jgi:hypothetical protein
MTLSYTVGTTKMTQDFANVELTQTKGRGIFHPAEYAIVGVTTNGEKVVLKSGLNKKKASALYNKIQRKTDTLYLLRSKNLNI